MERQYIDWSEELDQHYDAEERDRRKAERKTAEAQRDLLRDVEEAFEEKLQTLSLSDQISLVDYIERQIVNRRKTVEFWHKKRNEAPEGGATRQRYQRRLDVDMRDLNRLVTQRRVLDDALEAAAELVPKESEEEGPSGIVYRGDEIAVRCRSYIETATTLNHAYAIGHASVFGAYSEDLVRRFRSNEERGDAKYVEQDWKRAGYLDKKLKPSARVEELKRRIIRFADEGIAPPRP